MAGRGGAAPGAVVGASPGAMPGAIPGAMPWYMSWAMSLGMSFDVSWDMSFGVSWGMSLSKPRPASSAASRTISSRAYPIAAVSSFQICSVFRSVSRASTCVFVWLPRSVNAAGGSFFIFTSRNKDRPPIASERYRCASGSRKRSITASRVSASFTATA